MEADLNPQASLLITGDGDELFPVSHYESLAAELEKLAWERIAEGDFLFSTCRNQLVRIAVSWLLETLGN